MLKLDGLTRFQNDYKLTKKLAFLEIEWRRSCPDVDLQDQLGWAHYWVSTNSKGAHYKDMARFLSYWFKRCQIDIQEKRQWNRRQIPDGRVTPNFVEQKPPEEEVMTAEDFQKMKEAIRDTKRPVA